MATIVKRNNSFAVVYMTTVNGVRKQKWETYHTLPEAVRRKDQLELYHDLRKSKKIGGEVETVAQLMSVYLRLHGVPRWSPSTYRSNCGLIQHYILPCMGDMRLSELSPRTVAALYSQMLEEPRISSPYHKQGGQRLSPTTLRSIHKVLHSAFEQAVLWEYVDRNPFHRAPLPTCRPKQKAFLTPEQIKQLVLHLHLLDQDFNFSRKVLAPEPMLVFLPDCGHRTYDAFCSPCLLDNDAVTCDIFLPRILRDKSSTPESMFLHELGHVLNVRLTGDLTLAPSAFLEFGELFFPGLSDRHRSVSGELFAHCFAMGVFSRHPELRELDPFTMVTAEDKQAFGQFMEALIRTLPE